MKLKIYNGNVHKVNIGFMFQDILLIFCLNIQLCGVVGSCCICSACSLWWCKKRSIQTRTTGPSDCSAEQWHQ